MTKVVGADEAGNVEVALEVELEEIELAPGTPQSPLDLLKGRRKDLEAKLFLDLAVPRWEDIVGKTIWVRYKPADVSLWGEAQRTREAAHLAKKKRDGHGDPKWAIKANADVLVAACVGVYFLEPGEEPLHDEDFPADLPTFSDPALSTALDAPRNAVGTVLKLYGTDADVLLAANQIIMWSGESSKEAGEAFLED